ncbi:MAG: T9SS C-terminal target domain-containing protein [Candidatus Zixiibacteriota bacterium]|nr:MAG: T9SS C-terminal target domain-containing protein [candidate division Zixibacteria bacterium]
MTRFTICLTLILCLAGAAMAEGHPAVQPRLIIPALTGTETVNAPVIFPPYGAGSNATDQYIGDTMTVGTTWYENQHNGSIGRMLDIGEDGYLHLAWMNGLEAQAINRHVFYNYLDPSGTQGYPYTGYPVESAVRGGFANLDVDYANRAFPAFHQQATLPNTHLTAAAVDLFPHSGAFLVYEPQYLTFPGTSDPMQIIWPKMQFDRNHVMHIAAVNQVAAAALPQQMWYTYGTYDSTTFMITFPAEPDSSFREIGWTMTIAIDVGTSEVSDKIAFAWTHNKGQNFPDPANSYAQIDNDLWVLIDQDGQNPDFSQAINITNFFLPDTNLFPDSTLAQMDTLRAYNDCNVFIDSRDVTHVTFTTRNWLPFDSASYWHPSIIWHWSEEFPDEFHGIHYAFDDWEWNFVYCGAWNVKAQRPQLGEHLPTGNLYCMYQVYDTDTTRLGQTIVPQNGLGLPSGEIYLSYSEDHGRNWHEGVNVTHTVTGDSAAPGECLSELTPSMAKQVDDACHILYVLDRDAGNVIQTAIGIPEGTWTLNPVIYQRVPISLIPATPLVPQWPEEGSLPLHVDHAYSVPPVVGFGGTPGSFALEQNYPNPFNPMTAINFSLDRTGEVNLVVYNLKGELVAQLATGVYSAGRHQALFDATGLASGIYLYRLKAGERTLQHKMVLLK